MNDSPHRPDGLPKWQVRLPAKLCWLAGLFWVATSWPHPLHNYLLFGTVWAAIWPFRWVGHSALLCGYYPNGFSLRAFGAYFAEEWEGLMIEDWQRSRVGMLVTWFLLGLVALFLWPISMLLDPVI